MLGGALKHNSGNLFSVHALICTYLHLFALICSTRTICTAAPPQLFCTAPKVAGGGLSELVGRILSRRRQNTGEASPATDEGWEESSNNILGKISKFCLTTLVVLMGWVRIS